MKKKTLSERQKLFADYYLKEENAYKAAIEAGYSEKYAKAQSYKLLDSVGMQEYIKERMEQVNAKREAEGKKRIADLDEVLGFLTDSMRGEIKDQFELDPSLRDRQDAAKELLRRYDKLDGKGAGFGKVVIVNDLPTND